MKERFLLTCLLVIFCFKICAKTGTTTLVSVKIFGAIGNGSDATSALQKAADSNKPIYFPPGRYVISKPITHTGKIHWVGSGNKSVILTDGVALNITAGSNSVLDNLRFENITTPWVIIRDKANLDIVPKIVKSNATGYQPTVNDLDVWKSITAEQQNQNIGPLIMFSGHATNILINRIYGNFVGMLISDANNSTVSNCDIKGGKNYLGGICFLNFHNQDGVNNVAKNNKVRYASFNGIVFIANHDSYALNNVTQYCGESGIKLYQGDLDGASARNYKMHILNNFSQYNFYDGFDLTTDNPRTGKMVTNHEVKGNRSIHNGQTGFYADGIGNQFTGNSSAYNMGAGINGYFNNTYLVDNNFIDNNLRNTPTGVHEIGISGAGNYINNNVITRTGNRAGYAIYATELNNISGNKAKGSTFFFGVPGTVKARLSKNTSAN